MNSRTSTVNRFSVLKLKWSSAIGPSFRAVCGVEGTVIPFDSCLSVQKADVSKSCQGRVPNTVLIYKKTSISILHASKYVNVVLLTCYSGGYFLTLLPWGLPFPLILRTNWIFRLLSALTDTYSPFFPVCSLPLSFISPYCLSFRWQMLHENRKEKSKGSHNVQTDRSHYTLKMCGKTEMDNR